MYKFTSAAIIWKLLEVERRKWIRDEDVKEVI